MKKFKERMMEKREEGAALVIAILILSAIEILGFALITMSEIDYSVANNLMRSEQALYAAEQGAMLGIEYVYQNKDSLNVGDTAVKICSRDYRNSYLILPPESQAGIECGDNSIDPIPRWEAYLKNVGSAPGSQQLKMKNYRFQVYSIGIGNRGLQRSTKVEFGMLKRLCGGGICGKERGTKLAGATYLYY